MFASEATQNRYHLPIRIPPAAIPPQCEPCPWASSLNLFFSMFQKLGTFSFYYLTIAIFSSLETFNKSVDWLLKHMKQNFDRRQFIRTASTAAVGLGLNHFVNPY